MSTNFGRNKASRQKYLYLCPEDFDCLQGEDDMEYVRRTLGINVNRNTYELNEEDIL